MSPEKRQFKVKRDNKQYTTKENKGGFVILGKVHSEWINDTQGYNWMTYMEEGVARFKEQSNKLHSYKSLDNKKQQKQGILGNT